MIEYTFDQLCSNFYPGTVRECIKFILSKHQNHKEFWLVFKNKIHHYKIEQVIKYKIIKDIIIEDNRAT